MSDDICEHCRPGTAYHTTEEHVGLYNTKPSYVGARALRANEACCYCGRMFNAKRVGMPLGDGTRWVCFEYACAEDIAAEGAKE